MKRFIFIIVAALTIASCGSLKPHECPTYAGYKSPSGEYYHRLQKHSKLKRKVRAESYASIHGYKAKGYKKRKIKITVAAY